MLRNPLFRAGLILGLGLGGFFDGIVLHQILGWHHMICTTETCRPDSVAVLMRQNTQDGVFHLAMWILTIIGVGLIVRTPREDQGAAASRVTLGGAIAGWGAFNLVEGLIDHQLLGIHHVRPDSPHWLAYDLAFLASGLLLWLGGRYLARSVADGPKNKPASV